MRKLLFGVICLFVLGFGCGTKKIESEMQAKAVSSEKLDVSSRTAVNVDKAGNDAAFGIEHSTEATDWSTVIKVFSKPDSVCHQYLVSETTTKGKTVKSAQSINSSEKKDSLHVNSESVGTDKSKVHGNIYTEIKSKEETKSPVWVSVGVVIGITGLVFLLFLFLKKVDFITKIIALWQKIMKLIQW